MQRGAPVIFASTAQFEFGAVMLFEKVHFESLLDAEHVFVEETVIVVNNELNSGYLVELRGNVHTVEPVLVLLIKLDVLTYE